MLIEMSLKVGDLRVLETVTIGQPHFRVADHLPVEILTLHVNEGVRRVVERIVLSVVVLLTRSVMGRRIASLSPVGFTEERRRLRIQHRVERRPRMSDVVELMDMDSLIPRDRTDGQHLARLRVRVNSLIDETTTRIGLPRLDVLHRTTLRRAGG